MSKHLLTEDALKCVALEEMCFFVVKTSSFQQSSPAYFCLSNLYQCFQQNHPAKAKNLLVNAGSVLYYSVRKRSCFGLDTTNIASDILSSHQKYQPTDIITNTAAKIQWLILISYKSNSYVITCVYRRLLFLLMNYSNYLHKKKKRKKNKQSFSCLFMHACTTTH